VIRTGSVQRRTKRRKMINSSKARAYDWTTLKNIPLNDSTLSRTERVVGEIWSAPDVVPHGVRGDPKQVQELMNDQNKVVNHRRTRKLILVNYVDDEDFVERSIRFISFPYDLYNKLYTTATVIG